eukprot:s4527_g5.t1
MDIVIHAVDGDATNPATRQFWLDSIRRRFVIAFVGGPPCETWSRARAVRLPGQDEDSAGDGRERGPRILRNVEQAWGFEVLSLSELFQVMVGNELLGFSLLAMLDVAIADAFGILEHPSEAHDSPSAAVRVILSLPCVQKYTLAQGLMGARTPKPTTLLAANMDNLMVDLHRCRVRGELPKTSAIGKNSLGQWRTTELKEYSPGLCKAFALSLARGISEAKVDQTVEDPPIAFLDRFRALNVQEFGREMGADYAGNGGHL